jgi:hypothetical protein
MNNIYFASLYLNTNKPINSAHKKKKERERNEHSSLKNFISTNQNEIFSFSQIRNSFYRLINENEISSF